MSDTSGPLVLYVEDEPLIRDLAVAAFDDAGYVVVVAPDGSQAMTILDARANEFAALVTDIDLGPGPNGWDVARHAREAAPRLPVIYVSGGSGGDWSSQGVPGSVILAKPYATAQLVVAVSTATVESDPGGPSPS